MGFKRRRVITALLAANAVKPLSGRISALGFAVGWPTSELAPQLLALTAADTAQAVLRGKASKSTVLLAGASAAAFGYLITGARRTGPLAETALTESLGADYLEQIPDRPSDADLKVPLRDLARPFSMMKPGVEVIRDINYRDGGSRARLDIYRPVGVDLTDAPVLIQVHGGGWTMGDKSQQGLLLMNRMAARGWVCVAINYRLAPKHPFPAQIVDVKKAIAWTRDNIASYGGDPSYLVITGGSAGGHLASLAALTPEVKEYQPGFEAADTRVSACVPFYGVYDLAGITGDKAAVEMRDLFLAKRIFKQDPKTQLEAFELASPLTHVTPDSPDFFVLHGVHDGLVSIRQARAFVEKLRAISTGMTTYLELPGTQHAFEVFSSIRSQQVIRSVERWLEWHRANRRTATRDQLVDA
ncbi:alpha/beta hydrolase [Nocardioides marmoriginsengisoli]|uniref:Alpha/beta hydrolase n=1 Tax=Nocardioides marmoriginsengisoli TaxID=661483 RepID=A0A3N0CN88_9ACTN|nr:alpha/beta hydrolase [Nocardioides marmoriginsengisoli]RNL64799.1 alpha/beta hydrolase [Nocardioides marmoriginsengisoli]